MTGGRNRMESKVNPLITLRVLSRPRNSEHVRSDALSTRPSRQEIRPPRSGPCAISTA